LRQFGRAMTDKWQPTVPGGVMRPDAIIAPNPNTRFAITAARLAALAPGHPRAAWLSSMARLASAQQLALAAVAGIDGAASSVFDQALDAGLPPIKARGHRRNSSWRTALFHILDAVDVSTMPPRAHGIVAGLRAESLTGIEALADQYLRGDVRIGETGAALYVGAALQVYFTALAAKLPPDHLRLLPERRLCPCCGSMPSAGLIPAAGNTPEIRHLYCSLCSTAWHYTRTICTFCGECGTSEFPGITGDAGAVKVETCSKCFTYAKMIYREQDIEGDPYADDLASLELDSVVTKAGWTRRAPNSLLLVAR
jgi:FdhE protein